MRKDYIIVIVFIAIFLSVCSVDARTKDEAPYVGVETTGASGLRGNNEFIVIKGLEIKKNKYVLVRIEKLYRDIQDNLKTIEKAKPDLSLEDNMQLGILIDSIDKNLDEIPHKDSVILKPLAEELKKLVENINKSPDRSELDKAITELEENEKVLQEAASKK